MKLEDITLSKQEILQKYPQGSPDYPTHHKGCGCSGCYASWVEWRAGHKAVKLIREAEIRSAMAKAVRFVTERVYAEQRRYPLEELHKLANAIESGEISVP